MVDQKNFPESGSFWEVAKAFSCFSLILTYLRDNSFRGQLSFGHWCGQRKFRKARDDTTGWTEQLDSEQITPPSTVFLCLNQKRIIRNMQLHFRRDKLLESCKLLEKSNYFEGLCFSQQQFLKCLRRLKMLLVVKQGWSTSVWVMALVWFPSCHPLSISPTSRSQTLWYLWKVGKLHAHFRNELSPRQRHRW